MPIPFAVSTAPPHPPVLDLPPSDPRPSDPQADGDAPSVAFVFWPREEEHRRRLAERGAPRLLLLAVDAPAPESSDPLEGWIREPFDAADLDARLHQLQGRARRAERAARRPHVDADGVLHSGGRRADLTDSQIGLVTLLLERLGEVVPFEDLGLAARRAGAAGTDAATRRALHRCRAKLAPLDLELHTFRTKGVLLCVASDARQGAVR